MSNADKIPNQQIYQNTANIITQVNQINEFPSETQNTVLVLNSINQNTCELAKNLLSKESYRSFLIQQKTMFDQLLSDQLMEDETLGDEDDDWEDDPDTTMYDDEFAEYDDEFDEES